MESETYESQLDWLFHQLPMFSRVGAAAYKPGLDTSLALDAFFGHPHRCFRSVHVGGTNGKGSVSHSLAAILMSQGYKVGLYTSPHLVDFRERIRVNGEKIPQDEVADFIRRYRSSGYEGHPSFFELTMMMAFDYFRKSRVDIAVIEVGMGGRLDSTNIISPLACVITNISKDHTQFLGSTLLEIAGEKAGIIKTGVPVVIGEAEGEVRRLFERKGTEAGAAVRFADEVCKDVDTSDLSHITDSEGHVFSFALKGDYQRANVRTLLAAVAMLRECGVGISDDAVDRGMRNVCRLTGLAGRWMQIADSPLTIADTGHNEAGISSNMRQLAHLRQGGRRLHMVIGFVADKDVDHILSLLPQDAIYYVTQAQIPRAMPAGVLSEKCLAAGLAVKTFPCVEKAYAAACRAAEADDIIYVGGSTFIVADLLASLHHG